MRDPFTLAYSTHSTDRCPRHCYIRCLQIVGADDDILGVWYASSDVASDTICWIEVPQGDVTDVNTNLWWVLIFLSVVCAYI